MLGCDTEHEHMNQCNGVSCQYRKPWLQQEGRWKLDAEPVFVALASIQGILGCKFWRAPSLRGEP